MMKSWQVIRVEVLAWLMIFSFTAGCTQPDDIRLGMSEKEVIERLGEPSSIAVQEGKLLRKLEKAALKEMDGKRIVYIYEASGLQVWFEHGKVTGMTKDGVSVLSFAGIVNAENGAFYCFIDSDRVLSVS